MSWQHEYSRWRDAPDLSARDREELDRIAGSPEELADRFGAQLSFGTGGLRGKLGLGTSRMNRFTVRRASLGYASYLLDRAPGSLDRGVVIAYDPRIGSKEFADEAARVLAAAGIPVYVFDGIRPTPLLSYAVRALGAAGGIVITASHNPPEYNGYKVYGPDGGQLLPDHANDIAARADAAVHYLDPPGSPVAPIHALGDEVDLRYLRDLWTTVERVAGRVAPLPCRSDLGIVYTALHGTGYRLVPAILERLGFSNVTLVEEQCVPDGNFPTLEYPNPEDPSAFDLAIKTAEGLAARGRRPLLLLATDPDCDRLGACVWDGDRYQQLTGNQLGVLLVDTLVANRLEKRDSLQDCVIMKTIVSTDMVRPMCEPLGIQVIETLTGFKYIGAKMGELQDAERQFILGFEESCGYLAGDLCRDKDGVMAAALTACAAARALESRIDLLTVLRVLYIQYGHYHERLLSLPISAAYRPSEAMQALRNAPPDELAGFEVTEVRDYLAGHATVRGNSVSVPIDLPREDCIQLVLAGGGKVTLRPSGTEPKLKLYVAVTGSSEAEAAQRARKVAEAARKLLPDND